MKRCFAALAAVLVFASMSFAAETFKLGSVDFQRALNESDFGAKTRTELETTIKKHQATVDEQMKKLDAMKSDLEAQSSVLSQEAFRQRVEEVEKFERDLERQVNDSNEELAKIQRRKEYEILKDLDTVVVGIAKEDGYDLILPVDVIIYSSEGLDITDKVISRYNEMKKNASSKPAEGGK